MNYNKCLLIMCIFSVISILCGISYKLGCDTKPAPKYISIDNQGATRAMRSAGITDQQISQVYEYLKNKR